MSSTTKHRQPPHLVHVFPSDSWGGAEIYVLQLAHWQQQAGVKLSVWCKAQSPMHEEALRRGLRTITDPLPSRRFLWQLPKITQLLRREKVSHLQLHWSGGVVTFAGIKYLYPVKVFYHPHMFIDYRKKDFLHRWMYQQLDVVFAAGEKARQSYLKNLPLKSSQIAMIPYALEDQEIAGNSSPDFSRWNLSADDFHLAYLGRLDRQKGVKEFLLASLPLLAKYPRLKLLIVGDPTRNEPDSLAYQKELQEIIQHSGKADRIIRLPGQKDFRSLLSCMKMLVMPSYQETYSLLILHAFSLGVPVLSTAAGGTPDLIGESEERGWLVPPKNIEQLQNKLDHLLQNPQEIEKRRDICRTYVKAEHQKARVIAAFLKMDNS